MRVRSSPSRPATGSSEPAGTCDAWLAAGVNEYEPGRSDHAAPAAAYGRALAAAAAVAPGNALVSGGATLVRGGAPRGSGGNSETRSSANVRPRRSSGK